MGRGKSPVSQLFFGIKPSVVVYRVVWCEFYVKPAPTPEAFKHIRHQSPITIQLENRAEGEVSPSVILFWKAGLGLGGLVLSDGNKIFTKKWGWPR